MPATAPWEWTNRAIRARGATCASLQMPRSPLVIRPSAVTAVASTITSATPPAARLPRWTRCQSSANPSVATYWHMGRHHDPVAQRDRADRERAGEVDLGHVPVVVGAGRAAVGCLLR